MKGLAGSGALALVVAAGCSSAPPAPEATAQSTNPIQGGTDDTTHNFAVGIFLNLGGGEGAMCSGALLAPNLVATARHCVAQLSSDQVDCSSSTFGALYSTSQYIVTNSPVLSQGATQYAVSKIIVPTASNQVDVCGNDIALLILSSNIQLPEYVEPVINPPMTDHSAWATTVTAIGYGIDSPTDTQGQSAGTRRIKENIALSCIPNDTTFTDCYSDPAAKSVIAATEFESGDGTCEGDSGSSAYDQTQFNAGKWASFGVLSRGGVSSDGTQCVGSIYSRFDAWGSLLTSAATEAAQAGGYAPPAWATSSSSSGGSSSGGSSGSSGSGDDGGATSGLGNGTTCNANGDCTSNNCVSKDGKVFVCAGLCSATSTCGSGTSCDQGYCFPDAPQSSSSKSGCAVGRTGDPTHPVPWRAATLALAAVGLALARRRRR